MYQTTSPLKFGIYKKAGGGLCKEIYHKVKPAGTVHAGYRAFQSNCGLFMYSDTDLLSKQRPRKGNRRLCKRCARTSAKR
jgi:hypothetical protein